MIRLENDTAEAKKSWRDKFVKKDDGVLRFKILWPGMVLAGCVLVAALVVVLVFTLPNQEGNIFSPGPQAQIYFFSSSEGRLVAEGRPWPHGNQLEWVAAALGHLRFPPNNSRLTSTWPNINPLIGIEETPFLLDFSVWEGTMVAEFYDSYLEMPPLQEALFRSALTLTMVNSGFIDEVIIRVNGHEWIETAETIANAPSISPSQFVNTQLVLYFIDESGEGLVREYYNAVEIDARRRVEAALEQLIEGNGTAGAFSAIPPETRVLAVTSVTESSGIYVNLSGDFLRLSSGPMQTQLMVAAMVNTVLANSDANLRQVFFLVDFSRAQLPGIEDFTIGFEYDETAMLGYVPDDAYSYAYEPEEDAG